MVTPLKKFHPQSQTLEPPVGHFSISSVTDSAKLELADTTKLLRHDITLVHPPGFRNNTSTPPADSEIKTTVLIQQNKQHFGILPHDSFYLNCHTSNSGFHL